MAAVDKIYGTHAQGEELREWLKQHLPVASRFLYDGVNFSMPDHHERPLSNFPEDVDKFLLEECTLDWVVVAIKKQYNLE